MELDPILVTARVTAVLEDLGVKYLIVESLASTLYGMVRTTQDSDIIAELKSEHTGSFVSALQGEFYADEEMIAEAIAHRASFNIVHRESMFKVDIFIPRQRPFVQSQLARARMVALSDKPHVDAMVASAEDTVLAKLEWYRLGGETSERQWRDILGVLKVQAGAFDLNYLRRWAGELEVADLLERALGEA